MEVPAPPPSSYGLVSDGSSAAIPQPVSFSPQAPGLERVVDHALPGSSSTQAGTQTPMRKDAPPFTSTGAVAARGPPASMIHVLAAEPERLVPVWQNIAHLPCLEGVPYIMPAPVVRGVPQSLAQLNYEHALMQGVHWPNPAAATTPLFIARSYYHLTHPHLVDYGQFRSAVQEYLNANTAWSYAISAKLAAIQSEVRGLSYRVASLEREVATRNSAIHSVSVSPGTHEQLKAAIQGCQHVAYAMRRGHTPVYSPAPSCAPSVAGSELCEEHSRSNNP